MVAGYYGLGGVGPAIALQMHNTYTVPVLLYGLEALVLSDTDIKGLSMFHRKNLRYIHLPKSTAMPAVYLLLGTLPIQAQLDIRTLLLIRKIMAAEAENPPALYRNLINRQLAMKDVNS